MTSSAIEASRVRNSRVDALVGLLQRVAEAASKEGVVGLIGAAAVVGRNGSIWAARPELACVFVQGLAPRSETTSRRVVSALRAGGAVATARAVASLFQAARAFRRDLSLSL